MTIEIREATRDEHDEAGRVTAEAYRELASNDGWEDYLVRIADVAGRATRTTILVAVEAGQILGSLTLELHGRVHDPDEDHPPLSPDEAHIRMLGVLPAARRRGAARLLMQASERRARAAGRTRMTLNTTRRMAAAQQLYETLGFLREPDRVFPDGFVLLSYAKDLASSDDPEPA